MEGSLVYDHPVDISGESWQPVLARAGAHMDGQGWAGQHVRAWMCGAESLKAANTTNAIWGTFSISGEYFGPKFMLFC